MGIGERPFLVAEEFAFEQGFRERRAIDGDERLIAAGAQVVNRAGHDFLARTVLAENQHGQIGIGDAARGRTQRVDRRRIADEPHARGGFFGKLTARLQEPFALLRILQRGDIAPDRLYGSWAGAFGHTQFMPATYERLAVDFDGDGRRDLVDNSADALASTANFLRRGGWQSDLPWGFEVRLPPGFDSSLAGRKNKRPMSEWAARGVVAVDGKNLANSGLGDGERTAILLPAGPRGPAFIVTRNFDVIYGYNAAESYALAIAHLADRLRGGAPFVAPWPTDDAGLSRAERRELQTLLAARGHDIGDIDGALGDRSRAAIKLEQARLGQEATGRGGQKILNALRGGKTVQNPAQ